MNSNEPRSGGREPAADLRTAKISHRFTAASTAVLTAACLVLSARAADFEVQNLDDAGPGSLRDAITQAEATAGADVITFNPALFASGPQIIQLLTAGDMTEGNSAFGITTIVTIQGPLGANGLTLQGPGDGGDLRHFYLSTSADLTLENVTLADGNSAREGGAIWNDQEESALLTIIHSTLRDNHSASHGGAVFGALTLIDSTLSNNSAVGSGGGVGTFAFNHSVEIIRSTLSANYARADLNQSDPISARGGGLFAPNPTVIDSTISGNWSDGLGGGLFSRSAGFVVNTTITGNRSDSDGNGFNAEPGDEGIIGGGLFADGIFISGDPPLEMHNTIVAGNYQGTGNIADDVWAFLSLPAALTTSSAQVAQQD